MCITTKIAALEAQIARLKNLQVGTLPVKTALTALLEDYAAEAPDELFEVWDEILAIGSQYNLAVQPISVAEELRQWEAAIAENEKLKQQLEEAQLEDRAWRELSDERDDLVKELAELRSQLPENYWQDVRSRPSPKLEYEPDECTDRRIAKKNLETPGQLSTAEEELSLDEEEIPELGGNWEEDEDISAIFTKPEPPDLIKEFSITNLPLPHQGMRVRITPAIGDGKFAGATFTFYRGIEELFSSSETAEQIARGENNPELIAVALAESWLKQQKLKNQSPAGTTHTESPVKNEFTELVYSSEAVAYLKRKDTGEILNAYLGFSNKTSEGHRAPTRAKSRAMKWQEHLVGVCQLTCSGPRECQRIESKNQKMPFKYELKLVKPSMEQIQKLSQENFGLYPDEVEEKQKGSEARSELLTPPTETKFSDFEFERAADFDELNPEFSVKYKGHYVTNIWSSLQTTAGQQLQRLWRHRHLKPGEEIELKDTEAAAFHALQRARGLT